MNTSRPAKQSFIDSIIRFLAALPPAVGFALLIGLVLLAMRIYTFLLAFSSWFLFAGFTLSIVILVIVAWDCGLLRWLPLSIQSLLARWLDQQKVAYPQPPRQSPDNRPNSPHDAAPVTANHLLHRLRSIQPKVCDALENWLRQTERRASNGDATSTLFLCIGPIGTGKTEGIRDIAAYLAQQGKLNLPNCGHFRIRPSHDISSTAYEAAQEAIKSGKALVCELNPGDLPSDSEVEPFATLARELRYASEHAHGSLFAFFAMNSTALDRRLLKGIATDRQLSVNSNLAQQADFLVDYLRKAVHGALRIEPLVFEGIVAGRLLEILLSSLPPALRLTSEAKAQLLDYFEQCSKDLNFTYLHQIKQLDELLHKTFFSDENPHRKILISLQHLEDILNAMPTPHR